VIAVRAYELARPARVAMNARYEGCRSWVSLDEEIDIDGSRPALSDAELQTKIDAVSATLWN
jgi:hypothetical protein